MLTEKLEKNQSILRGLHYSKNMGTIKRTIRTNKPINTSGDTVVYVNWVNTNFRGKAIRANQSILLRYGIQEVRQSTNQSILLGIL